MSNFTFNISLSVLNHLGRNLYRNFITVLGEAISNSWDADAENVWIYINREKNFLVVKDDGTGMDANDFQSKFLKIGYSKRKEGLIRTDGERPFIGRKGIGKLALLSCADRIHIATKTTGARLVGGIIDNRGLDEAITDDLTPQEYLLGEILTKPFGSHIQDFERGTIIYFENFHDGISNREEYLRKLIALYFRFSLIDGSFKIFLNDQPITLDELDDLALGTQFVWQLNSMDDPYLKDKISATSDHIRRYKKVISQISISGFIASVEKPSNLKIRTTDEKVTVDLYVNGRLREKDLLKHIPSARIVESYLYGQIHYNDLDGEKDRFTSSREGVISDDPQFQELLLELKNILKSITEDWDVWRVEINQDGDAENTVRMTKKQRKSKELIDTIVHDYTPPKDSSQKDIVEGWVKSLSSEAQYNVASYADCFVSENLLRKFIKHKGLALSPEAAKQLVTYKNKEEQAKNRANISFNIREDAEDLLYFSMDDLANFVDKTTDPNKVGISRDAKVYKPVRDAMAHTSILTTTAKNSLNTTFENIKARIKKLLE